MFRQTNFTLTRNLFCRLVCRLFDLMFAITACMHASGSPGGLHGGQLTGEGVVGRQWLRHESGAFAATPLQLQCRHIDHMGMGVARQFRHVAGRRNGDDHLVASTRIP